MPAPLTRADALVAHLSGAAADGDAQPDPALSLGGFRSSARAASLGVRLAAPIPGVRVDFASPANGPGTGSLRAYDSASLIWTPPGADGGAAVPVADGQQVLVEGADPAAYLLVTRTAAADLAGQAAVTLTQSFNDLFGQADADLSAPELPTYRLVVFKNAGRAVVRDLRVWLGPCDHDVRLAAEEPSAQPAGDWQLLPDATTAPAAVTFAAPTAAGDAAALVRAVLRPGEQVGVWAERTVPVATAAATPRARLTVLWSYTAVG